MNDQSHGYDVSVAYSRGFYREMAPDWIDFCARLAGHQVAPRGGSVPFRYLELGSGQGVGLCLLAAANPAGEFVGVDFLPEHIANARALAEAAGLANVSFEAADFLDLAARWPDHLGTFDYVALHGVYNWVSPPVRAAIVACLGHATRAGSLVYNAYNTQPGWLGSMPFQHLALLLRNTGGQSGAAALQQAIALFELLDAGGTKTFEFLPALKERVASVKNKNLDYLIHEYLHEGWEPQWHSQVAAEMADAGLAYLGPAAAAETLLPGVLPPALRDTILEQADPRVREDVQDFVINQTFRRALFLRAAEAPRARDPETIGATSVHLIVAPRDDADLEINASFGDITLQPPAFVPIVDALADSPRTIAELAALPEAPPFEHQLQIVVMLLHARVLGIGGASGPDGAERLNAAIACKACEGAPLDHVAAAAFGSAVPAETLDLMLLDAWLAADRTSDGALLAAGMVERMNAMGGTFQSNGNPLGESEIEQYLAHLTRLFFAQSLPRWRRLGVIA